MPSEELIRAKKHLKALEEFIAGPAYSGFIIGLEEEIKGFDETILLSRPVDLESIFEQCTVRGEKQGLESMLMRFPSAAEELKDRIADLEDDEQKIKGGR